ncbi:MAG: chemotaxis response regulator protein-glutamate methylesterase [Actinobacteria bacterium]|nr:chemotaxis response regulator protein-glutamate methylesterase [Actinomycetota bacterium]MCL5887388.1 chemotaxis response regulator protein-glutamate methylesterase [Actinomycetota bacterium]
MRRAASIKVLVVDDSALIRQMLTRALGVDPRLEIVGTAKTGVEAIALADQFKPDVITLDIEMPELSGIEALPYIADKCDARVVMLSSLDDSDTTYQALSAGAVDFVCKPKAGMASSMTELSELLFKKIRTAYRIDPSRVREIASGLENRTADRRSHFDRADCCGNDLQSNGPPSYLVGIASSTGGPPALERVFAGLEDSLPAAYLVVQHLPTGFSASLARRISKAGCVEAVEARDGMPVLSGKAYIAPYGAHMRVKSAATGPRIHFDDGPPLHGVRPAADPLLASIASEYGKKTVGVILSGMGKDGAIGLTAVKAAGGATIAQDEQTSVVWGMPGTAVRAGVAEHVVPVDSVAFQIRRALRRADSNE